MLQPKKRKSILKIMSGGDTIKDAASNATILKQIEDLNTKGLKMIDDQENGVKGATEEKAHVFFDKALELEKKLKKNKQ